MSRIMYVRWIANQDTVWFSTRASCCRPVVEWFSSSGVTTNESCFRFLTLGLTADSWIKTCKYRRRGHNLIHFIWFSFLIIVERIDTKEPYSCGSFMLQRDNSTRFFSLGFPAICPMWPLIQHEAFLHSGFEFAKLKKLLKGQSIKIIHRWTPPKPLTQYLKTFLIWLRIQWDICDFWLTLRHYL
jgi:hypothetical protein